MIPNVNIWNLPITRIGTFQEAGVIQQAYNLNCPMLARNVMCPLELKTEYEMFRITSPAVIIDAIKLVNILYCLHKIKKSHAAVISVKYLFNANSTCYQCKLPMLLCFFFCYHDLSLTRIVLLYTEHCI